MESLFSSLQAAIAVAIATTFDDNIYLTGFFSETDRHFRPVHVVAGELIGFSLLMALSVILSRVLVNVLPVSTVGWLGTIPILIGLQSFLQLFATSAPRELDSVQAVNPRSHASSLQQGFGSSQPRIAAVLTDSRTYKVSAITISNGGNNLAIYIPLLGNSGPVSSLITVITCYIAVVCWLIVSFRLTRLPGLAVILSRYASKIFPFVLMWLGFRILGDSGALRSIT